MSGASRTTFFSFPIMEHLPALVVVRHPDRPVRQNLWDRIGYDANGDAAEFATDMHGLTVTEARLLISERPARGEQAPSPSHEIPPAGSPACAGSAWEPRTGTTTLPDTPHLCSTPRAALLARPSALSG